MSMFNMLRARQTPADGASNDDIQQCQLGSSCPTGTYPWGFIVGGFKNIQLDIVGFLAILGEATVLNNGQVAALSWTSLLPRLIPAPQALIRTSRPERLEAGTGTVIGPHSGNIRRHINHVPHILHQVAYHKHNLPSNLKPYEVRAIKIDWAEGADMSSSIQDTTKEAALGRRHSVSNKRKKGRMKANFRAFGPLAGLAYFGFAQSVALLVYSAAVSDGMSLLATIILSLVSTLTGIANHWKLKLPQRTEMRQGLPGSDVIIAYPNGSFLVVTCPEKISRLYFQLEECEYMIDSWQYRGICLLGTILLMIGVICLANATQDLQITWACMYIAINAAYWAVAALPSRVHWDLSSFTTELVERKWWNYNKRANGHSEYSPPVALDLIQTGGDNATFTEALWKAVAVTGGSHWARAADIAPDTNGWDQWLKQAESALPKNQRGDKMAGEKMSESSPIDAHPHAGPLDDEERGRKVSALEVPFLPDWNYRQALDECLQIPNTSRWSTLLEDKKQK